jgi:hypothetical protein
MSRSFARFFKPILNSLKSNDEPLSSEMNKIVQLTLGTIAIGGTLGHGIYAFGTSETKFIKIKQKYTFDRNGFTEFMIIDENNKHYNVNNSIWYWKWNSIEDWHSIKEEQKLNTLTYGWRLPILGLFPNIVSCQNNKIDDIIVKDMSLIQDLSDGKFS